MMSSEIKIVLYGKHAIGKSSLVERYRKDVFEKNIESTIGAAFCIANLYNQIGELMRAQIWDTAGMEKFKSIVPMYLRGANIIIFCFDVPILSDIQEGIKFIKNINTEAKIVLVQTKIDIYRANIINEDLNNQLDIFIEREGYKIFYTSAKTGHSVKDLFEYCITKGYEIKKGVAMPLVAPLVAPLSTPLVERNDSTKYGCCSLQ